MFPFYDYSSEWDDFGEVINPDDYVIKDVNIDQMLMPVSILQNHSVLLLFRHDLFDASSHAMISLVTTTFVLD